MTGYSQHPTNSSLGCCLFRLLVIMLSAFLTFPVAADTIVLDDFSQQITGSGASGSGYFFGDDGTGVTELSLGPGGSVAWSDTGTGIFGGTRRVTVSKDTTGSSLSSVKVNTGVFEVSHPDGDGALSISLNYQDAPVTAFTGVDWFVVDMQLVDQVASDSVFPTLRLYRDASTFAEKTFSTPLAAGPNILTLASMFQQLGTRNITRATVSMTAQAGADFKINLLAFTPTPEPGTVATGLLIATLCWYRHQRRKRPQA